MSSVSYHQLWIPLLLQTVIIDSPLCVVKGQFASIPELQPSVWNVIPLISAPAGIIQPRAGKSVQSNQSRESQLGRRLKHPEGRLLAQQQLAAVGHGRLAHEGMGRHAVDVAEVAVEGRDRVDGAGPGCRVGPVDGLH